MGSGDDGRSAVAVTAILHNELDIIVIEEEHIFSSPSSIYDYIIDTIWRITNL